MSRRRLLIVALAGALVLLAALSLRRPRLAVPVNPTPAPPAALSMPAPVPPPSVDPIELVEQRLFHLTNGERARQGLRHLELAPELSAAARLHSEDMLRRGYFEHVNPDREGPAERVVRARARRTGAIGENIWMRSGSTPPDLSQLIEEAVAALMASSAHRDNILRPGYRRLGVGAAVSGPEVRLTQVFME